MKFIVLVTPEAESNLVAAFDFIHSHSPTNAVEWLARVKTRIATLERFPERCEMAPESEWFGEEIRQSLEPPYRLLFRTKNGRASFGCCTFAIRAVAFSASRLGRRA